MVSASVRGMGVAVITRTSGCLAFRHQPQTLHDAEAMLFVDDREAQIFPFDVFFDAARAFRCRCATSPSAISFLSCDFSRCVAEPGQQNRHVAHFVEQVLEIEIMLRWRGFRWARAPRPDSRSRWR